MTALSATVATSVVRAGDVTQASARAASISMRIMVVILMVACAAGLAGLGSKNSPSGAEKSLSAEQMQGMEPDRRVDLV
jgi:hypothetical protein